MASPMTDAWSRSQYDKAQDKLADAIAILEEIYRDEIKTFENRPIHWQPREAGQAEHARLIVMDNLIDDLHEAADTMLPSLQSDTCEPAPTSHRAWPPTGTLPL